MTTPHPSHGRRRRRPLALFGLVLFLVLSARPGTAAAHAGLAESTPSDGAVVDTAPDRVRLVFNEDVTVPSAGIAVTDSAGLVVDDGDIDAGGRVASVGVAGLSDGGYAVTFRVISADGHVIAGATTFAVGRGAPAVDVAPTAWSPWAGVGALGRFLGTLGVMIAAGGTAVILLCRASLDRRTRIVLSAAAGVGVIGLLLGLPAQAAGLGGGRLVWNGGAWLGNGIGASVAAGIVGTVAAIALVRRSPTLSLVGSILATASFAMAGHTRTGTVAVEVAADIAHVAGGAVWLGGLVVLLSGRGRGTTARKTVIARFSTLATVAVVVVGAAGLALSLSEVENLDALTTTAYGRTLLVKTAIVALVGAAGIHNHFFLLPRVLAPEADPGAWTSFRRILGVETIGVLLVLGVTASLVNQSPIDARRAGSPAYELATELGPVLIDQEDNALELRFADPAVGSSDFGDEISVELRRDHLTVPAIQRTASRTTDGTFTIDPLTLPAAGDWTITIRVRVDRFQATSFSTTLPLT